MKIDVKITGQKKLFQQLKHWGLDAVPATQSALFIEANNIMAKSKRLVPVDTGALRSSGFVEIPEAAGNHVSVTLGYGGPAKGGSTGRNSGRQPPDEVGYAVIVHEDLEAHHPVGQAKYLEQPLKEAKSGMADRLSKLVRRKMRIK